MGGRPHLFAGRVRSCVAALALGLAAVPGAAAAADPLEVVIDLSDQRMFVTRAGAAAADWPVSTARAGKCTPVGSYRPQVLKRVHYSTLYDGAPMPWSIFFSGNYAIHGTTQTERLGEPASAGCVRLHPDAARTLFGWVLEAGMDATLIRVVE